MSEWISVDDRLPEGEDTETLWCYDESNNIVGLCYRWHGLWFNAEIDDLTSGPRTRQVETNNITHWAEANRPDPPKPKFGEEGYTPEESEVWAALKTEPPPEPPLRTFKNKSETGESIAAREKWNQDMMMWQENLKDLKRTIHSHEVK